MDILQLTHASSKAEGIIPLASSKSESNRALIIKALSGNQINLDNLAEARDTQTMIRLLESQDTTLDVLDAGTTMRFLTAYCAATKRKAVLTGTPRMCERPIGILVDALRELGATIEYEAKDGFPPIQIIDFEQKRAEISIRGDVSSQYISALLMVAPTLPQGLTLTLTGQVGSRPYIEMTLQLLAHFGIRYTWQENIIRIDAQQYQPNHYTVESDWSGASYWFSMVALAQSADITLLNLRDKSLQGDRAIVEIMDKLGVQSTFDAQGVRLTKKAAEQRLVQDFSDCPDIAQTVAVVCAAKGIEATLTGLKSLRIKETDRIAAIEKELAKFGVKVNIKGDDEIFIPKSNFIFDNQVVDTYDDHRMAMAFAPLALIGAIRIENPSVVNKSYPSFWKHLDLVGFSSKTLQNH